MPDEIPTIKVTDDEEDVANHTSFLIELPSDPSTVTTVNFLLTEENRSLMEQAVKDLRELHRDGWGRSENGSKATALQLYIYEQILSYPAFILGEEVNY